MEWEILERKNVFDAPPWITIFKETIKLPDGQIINDYYTIEEDDFVLIFALIDADNIIAIWQYKHGAKKNNLALPAGYILQNETPLEAAKRELLEETGYSAEIWNKIGTFVVDGNRGCGSMHIFIAEKVAWKQDPSPDDLEKITLELIPIRSLFNYLLNGTVVTAGAACGMAMGLNFLERKSELSK